MSTMTSLPHPANPAAVSPRSPSAIRLTLTHGKYQFLEQVRSPVAVAATMFFPAMSMLFFVVPQQAVAQNAEYATAATGQLLVFSAMSTALFTFGAGVSSDRVRPWESYLRTLPLGPAPRMIGRLLAAAPFSLLGFIPLLLVAGFLTAAQASAAECLLAVAALILAVAPFLAIAFAIGFGIGPKGAIAVVQLVLFPMAFAGGLFLPPQMFPAWLNSLSGWLPSRAGRDVMVGALTDTAVSWQSFAVLAAWTTLFVAIALALYRRDARRHE